MDCQYPPVHSQPGNHFHGRGNGEDGAIGAVFGNQPGGEAGFGKGDDGGGVDMVVLPDVRQAYDLDQQSGRTVLRRGVEVKTLTAVEKLRFADGETLTIRD